MEDPPIDNGQLNPMELPAPAAWQSSIVPFSENQEPFGYLPYIAYEVGLDKSFAVMRLLVPQFVELRGCVLIANTGRFSPESVDSWLTTHNGNIAAVEELLNRVELWDVFVDLPEDALTQRALAEFAEAMVLTWRAALQEGFPEKLFAVELRNEETTYGPTVSFYSVP